MKWAETDIYSSHLSVILLLRKCTHLPVCYHYLKWKANCSFAWYFSLKHKSTFGCTLRTARRRRILSHSKQKEINLRCKPSNKQEVSAFLCPTRKQSFEHSRVLWLFKAGAWVEPALKFYLWCEWHWPIGAGPPCLSKKGHPSRTCPSPPHGTTPTSISWWGGRLRNSHPFQPHSFWEHRASSNCQCNSATRCDGRACAKTKLTHKIISILLEPNAIKILFRPNACACLSFVSILQRTINFQRLQKGIQREVQELKSFTYTCSPVFSPCMRMVCVHKSHFVLFLLSRRKFRQSTH